MVYKSFLPSSPLQDVVRNYTIIHFQFRPDQPIPIKQRAPKPEQKIIFYLKGAPIHRLPSGEIKSPPPVSIFSHQIEQRKIQMNAEFFAFIIFLQPGALHRLIRLPMMELLHGCCDAELFFGTEVRAISDQLVSACSQSEMIFIVEQFMLRTCKALKEPTSIDRVALQLMTDPTYFSLDAIAQQACLSTKQFYRRFTEQIGLSPKWFSRLCRFNHAYRYKVNHPTISWSSIAQEFHYTDYHHMEKEFKEFTSLTPREWTKTHLSAPERILKLR